MKNFCRALLGSALVSLVPVAGAAQIAPAIQPAVSPVIAPAATGAVLRVGTEVPLRLREELTTKGKKVRTGYRFQLETSEPVMVQGVTVIPAGSPAVGEVTNARNKGMWGKSGKLNARILYVTVNGRQIRLTGNFDDKGTAGGIAAVAVSAVVFLPAGFFMTGTSAKVPAGAIVKAFVDEDVPLALAAAPVQPLTVGVPAPVVNASAPTPGAVQPASATTAQAKAQAATVPTAPAQPKP